MKTKLLFSTLCLSSLTTFTGFSQKTYIDTTTVNSLRPRYGIYGGLGLNQHSADFRKLSSSISEVSLSGDPYKSGSGNGIFFGLLYEHPIASNILIGARAFYGDRSGVLETSTPIKVNNANGVEVDGTSKYTIDSRFSSISLEPYLLIKPWKELVINVGVNVAQILKAEYDIKEALVDPPTGTFIGTVKQRIRNSQTNVELPAKNATQLAAYAGVGWELVMNKKKNILLVPEIGYQLALGDVTSEVPWKINAIRAGLSIKYSPFNMIEKPVRRDTIIRRDTVVKEIAYGELPKITFDAKSSTTESQELPDAIAEITTITEKYYNEIPAAAKPFAVNLSALSQSQLAFGRNQGQILVTEKKETLRLPLLTHVYFPIGKSSIPQRYITLSKDNASKFSEKQIDTLHPMLSYYNILNIIGKRLQQFPNSRLTLSGYSGNQDSDKLGQERVDVIAEYLSNVWGISNERIQKVSGTLPDKYSKSVSIDDRNYADEENNRVEIDSDEPLVIAPVLSEEIIRSPKNDTLVVIAKPKFDNSKIVKGVFTISEWSNKNIVVESLDTAKIELNFDNNFSKRDIQISFTGYDNQGLEAKAQTSVPVIVNEDKKIIEKFHVMLFDYNSDKVNKQTDQLVQYIKRKIVAGCKVTIVGHTDVIGKEDYNQKLSEKRAKSLQQYLGVKENINVVGVGESNPSFDNTLPEGRSYNRTVEIIVEYPEEK